MAYGRKVASWDLTEKFQEDFQDGQFDESEDEFPEEELQTHFAPFPSSSQSPLQAAWSSIKLMFPGWPGARLESTVPSIADAGDQSGGAHTLGYIKTEPQDMEDSIAASSGPDPMELCETVLNESKSVSGREVVQGEGIVGLSNGVQVRATSSDSYTMQGLRGRGRARGRGTRRGRGRGCGLYPGAERDWTQEDKPVAISPTDGVPPEVREKLESKVRGRASRERSSRQRLERECVAPSVMNENDKDAVLQDCTSEFKRLTEDDQFSKFEWRPMGSFRGEREPFVVEHTGPTQYFHGAYQAFRAIWTDDSLEHIASETNRYASSIPRSETEFHAVWYNTNMHEILILFAFWIMFGIIQMPSITSCFSMNPLLQTSVFRLMFNSKRYWALNRALYFSNALPRDSDKLCLLRPVIEHLREQFRKLYIPGQSICIDESLTFWTGFLAFRQHVETTAVQYGVKTCELCDSATGYLWDFFVFTGQEPTSEQAWQNSSETVLKLIRPLLGKGYTLFVDDWFNSPLLARYLKRNRTDCVGTLRKSCKFFPPLLAERSLSEGSLMAWQSDDVMVVTFQDKEQDSLLSTYHNVDQTATAAKPGQHSVHSIITDFRAGMGRDAKDQMLESYMIERKQSIKWYKKMFKRLLNASIQNSRILLEQSSGKRLNSTGFKLELVEEILKHHIALKPEEVRRQSSASSGLDPGWMLCDPSQYHGPMRPEEVRRQSSVSSGLDPDRIICNPSQYHGPTKIVKKSNPDNSDERRTTGKGVSKNITNCVYCRVALLKRGRTVYECAKCDVALCLDPCFKLYHTTP